MKKSETVKSFVDRVCSFASAHDLLVKGGKYLVALSGGADSVSLLIAMKALEAELGIKVEAAHCNFHLRGDESMRDEDFCLSLCRRLDVKLHLVHFATRDYAELHHVSIEMAARDLRYAYFENLRTDIGASDICVAHHRDDSVETVLLNLVRGTGLRGLRGIQPRNGHVVRPLLCVSRADILQFLEAEDETYVTDSTNLHNDVKRNKIRLDILPMLQQLNPSVAKSIFETSLRVGEALKVYDNAVGESVQRVVSPLSGATNGNDIATDVPIQIDTEGLLELPSPESTLFNILNERGFSASQVENVCAAVVDRADDVRRGQSGRIVQSATHELLFDRRRLVVQPLGWGVCTRSMRIPETGTYVYTADMKVSLGKEPVEEGYEPSRDSWCACVDADVAKFPLTLRPLHEGERFVPLGMKRSKLASDFLTDIKLTLFDKRRQLVLADADDRIVWLVGRRLDNRFRIGRTSCNALRISILQQKTT